MSELAGAGGANGAGHTWDVPSSTISYAGARTHVADWASVVLLAIVSGLVLATFQDYAVTNDEWIQHEYGLRILSYYQSWFADRSLFELHNLYLYGGLFDVAVHLLAQFVPLDPYELRHLLSAACGVGGLAAVIATARLIAGPQAGLIAGMVLAVTGSWYGTMFHHTKDVPLAAAMAGALYFLVRASHDMPRPRMAHVAGFGLCAGAALGIKSIALLLICYVPVALLINLPASMKGQARHQAHYVARASLRFLPGLAIAYVLMILAWPWAGQSLLNPIRGLFGFSAFAYDISTVLGGELYKMWNVPRWYVPNYLLIKLPLILLAGSAIGLFVIFRSRAGDDSDIRMRKDLALVAFAAFFPIACQTLTRGPAFCGLRHFLFVIPPLAILAGAGWSFVASYFARLHAALGAAVLAGVLLVAVGNGLTLARLHPYEYLVFNSLVGEFPGANRRYVTDYWFTSMPETVELLERYLARTEPPGAAQQTYTVGTCGERAAFEKVRGSLFVWTSNWKEADFLIAPTHMNCDDNSDGRIVGIVERFGAPIGIVKDQRNPVWEMAGE